MGQCGYGIPTQERLKTHLQGTQTLSDASRILLMGAPSPLELEMTQSYCGTLPPEDTKRHSRDYTHIVDSIAYSLDGAGLASGSIDGTVRLWNTDSRKLITTLTGHAGYVWSVAYSPDGKTVASGGSDNTIRLWDVATGESKRTLTGHTGSVRNVAYSPDGSVLASGSDDHTVLIWDLT